MLGQTTKLHAMPRTHEILVTKVLRIAFVAATTGDALSPVVSVGSLSSLSATPNSSSLSAYGASSDGQRSWKRSFAVVLVIGGIAIAASDATNDDLRRQFVESHFALIDRALNVLCRALVGALRARFARQLLRVRQSGAAAAAAVVAPSFAPLELARSTR